MRPLFAIIATALLAGPVRAEHEVSAAAIIHELNLARRNPASYADFVEQRRQQFSGKLYLGTKVPLVTHEGVRAVDEAITFLHRTSALKELALSPGLCQAAEDHCREQASGSLGHRGIGRTGPGERINRYGTCSGGWAENIAYGQREARDIVIALIVDDGVRGRGHRKNIFSPVYSVAGAAFGTHAKFGSVCSIDFAAEYAEQSLAGQQTGMSGSKL